MRDEEHIGSQWWQLTLSHRLDVAGKQHRQPGAGQPEDG